MDSWEIRTLGAAEVLLDSQPVVWQTTKAKELFFYLLTHSAGRLKGEIIANLWEEEISPKTSTRLRVTAYRIRRALNHGQFLRRSGDLYRLHPELLELSDAQRFLRALAAARATPDQSMRLALYRQALGWYHGDYLAGFCPEWGLERQEQLKSAFSQGLTESAFLACTLRRCREASEWFQQVARADPYSEERVHRKVMCCLATLEGADTAISYYRKYRVFLRQELDDTPMPETVDLSQQIKERKSVCQGPVTHL
ncbi:MAG: hypothetical protein HY335_05050 [Deinococcus sp.]|nr:hypothetical protein [Deinococcus sp.]